MSAQDNIEYQEPWNEDELTQIPFSFEPLCVTGFMNREILFSAKWRSEALIAPAPAGPWHIIHPGTDQQELLTTDHWKIVYPGIQHLDITDWHNLAGTYNRKNVRWSCSQNHFIYDNNRPVIFPTEEEAKTAEVSQLLESSRQILERTTATTTSMLPQTSPETPKQELTRKFSKIAATASTSKGKQPVASQLPTPPVFKAAKPISTTTNTKVLGTASEAFDETASKAEGFLDALRNYYYLNESLYPDDCRRVASALTHFKVGTPAGEWARDCQDMAQIQTPIDYGS